MSKMSVCGPGVRGGHSLQPLSQPWHVEHNQLHKKKQPAVLHTSISVCSFRVFSKSQRSSMSSRLLSMRICTLLSGAHAAQRAGQPDQTWLTATTLHSHDDSLMEISLNTLWLPTQHLGTPLHAMHRQLCAPQWRPQKSTLPLSKLHAAPDSYSSPSPSLPLLSESAAGPSAKSSCPTVLSFTRVQPFSFSRSKRHMSSSVTCHRTLRCQKNC